MLQQLTSDPPFPASAAPDKSHILTPGDRRTTQNDDHGAHNPTSAPYSTNNVPASTEPQAIQATDTKELTISHIPGQPALPLSHAHSHLISTLSTPRLDALYPHLWFVARRDPGNIDPLHMQRGVRGRAVIPCEDAGLHLVWRPGAIYVKPVPVCLLNYDFWALYLGGPRGQGPEQPADGGAREEGEEGEEEEEEKVEVQEARKLALGFMRSYARLVRHEIDLQMAQELRLLPLHVSWDAWSKFAAGFRELVDVDEVPGPPGSWAEAGVGSRSSSSLGDRGGGPQVVVARRYHYGQLRLSRLNWLSRFAAFDSRCGGGGAGRSVTGTFFYELPYRSLSEWVGRATVPLVFVFASLSLALSAMQVVVAVGDGVENEATGFRSVFAGPVLCWGFSVGVLVGLITVWILLLGIPALGLAWQFWFGFRNKNRTVSRYKERE